MSDVSGSPLTSLSGSSSDGTVASMVVILISVPSGSSFRGIYLNSPLSRRGVWRKAYCTDDAVGAGIDGIDSLVCLIISLSLVELTGYTTIVPQNAALSSEFTILFLGKVPKQQNWPYLSVEDLIGVHQNQQLTRGSACQKNANPTIRNAAKGLPHTGSASTFRLKGLSDVNIIANLVSKSN